MSKQLSLVLWGQVLHCLLFVRRNTTWAPHTYLSHRLSSLSTDTISQECLQQLNEWVQQERWDDTSTHLALPWSMVITGQIEVPAAFRHSAIVREIHDHLSRWGVSSADWAVDYQAKRASHHACTDVSYAAAPLNEVNIWKTRLRSAPLSLQRIDVDTHAASRLYAKPSSLSFLFMSQQHACVLITFYEENVLLVSSQNWSDAFPEWLTFEIQRIHTLFKKCIDHAILHLESSQVDLCRPCLRDYNISILDDPHHALWSAFPACEAAPILLGLGCAA